ncbi:MAG: S41 family peptidase [Polyangiaceae bacterium]
MRSLHLLDGAALATSLLLALSACGDDSHVVGGAGGSGGSGGGAAGGSGGAGQQCVEDEPPAVSTDWCDRFLAGAPSAGTAAVDWSRAHAWARFFGPVSAYSDADQALASALTGDAPFTQPALEAYVSALDPTVACSAAASTVVLGPASVTMRGEIAWVVPGSGELELPAEAKGVMVDLRDVPTGAEGRAAILAAVSRALANPISGLRERVREHTGMVDEVFSPNNVYTMALAYTDVPSIEPTGDMDLPLAVLTGDKLSPDAAEIAIALRLAKRAWLVGEDVSVSVAEARWQGIGSQGLLVRTRELYQGSARLPDSIPADVRSATPECFSIGMFNAGPIPDVALGQPARPAIQETTPFGDMQLPGSDGAADARAALLVAHGAARLFYPYFATVGDVIDERLEEVLDALPSSPSRKDEYQALRRFGNALTDGHNFVFANDPPPETGYIPLFIEDLGGAPVVRRSAVPGIDPGDTITRIDGVLASDWYATELARSGGATPGYQFNLATRELQVVTQPVEFELKDPSGATKTVTASPGPANVFTSTFVATNRPAGYLDDLGAPSLYYVNMSGTVLTDIADFRASLVTAAGATGLVVDMRGYPGVDVYEVARRLVQTPFSSPVFRVPVLDGVTRSSVDESSYDLTPAATPSFSGPIVLLVGHSTVSAAENFATMLVDADRVTVLGRQSAGTNGNITGVEVPGNFVFTFTGMEVRHADAAKSQFHGIGIVPTMESALSPLDFKDGIDRELADAVAYLLANP